MPSKLPDAGVVSADDVATAVVKNREIADIAAAIEGRRLFLKLAFRTDDIGTVFVDPIRADHLFRLLKGVLPNHGENDGSALNWADGAAEWAATGDW
jgi:hypothetical protein